MREFPAAGFATEQRELAAVSAGGPSPLDRRQGRRALVLCLACHESDCPGARVRRNVPLWRVPET